MNIEVKKILEKCREVDYVVLKKSDVFPLYKNGSDIDIFIAEPYKIIREIVNYCVPLFRQGLSMRRQRHNEHIHCDLIMDDKLLLRFDFIDRLIIRDLQVNAQEIEGIKYPSVLLDSIVRLHAYLENPLKKYHLENVKFNSLFKE